MSVRITFDENKVALFDSVTEMAFGPVFNSADEAAEFVDFVNEETDKDIREVNTNTLQDLKAEFDMLKEAHK